MNTEMTTELEELQDQARATVQLSQAERFTMQGHLREKLKIGRQRYRKTLTDHKQLPEAKPGEEVDDDMQILARDIDLSTKHIHLPELKPEPAPTPALPAPVATEPQAPVESKSRWPLAAALALGLGIPGTAGILMAPTIIDSLQNEPPVVNVPAQPGEPDYAPILLPGKPPGAK